MFFVSVSESIVPGTKLVPSSFVLLVLFYRLPLGVVLTNEQGERRMYASTYTRTDLADRGFNHVECSDVI